MKVRNEAGVQVEVDESSGSMRILFDGFAFVENVLGEFRLSGKDVRTDALKVSDVRKESSEDDVGRYVAVRVRYLDIPVELRMKVYSLKPVVVFEAEALDELDGLATRDSFVEVTFRYPVLVLNESLSALLYKYGLGGAEEKFPGGYWPEAVVVNSIREVDGCSAYGVAVVFDRDSGRSLAISPMNYFLTSALTSPSPATLARGLHGSVNRVRKGFTTKTLLVFGYGPLKVLRKLGDELLRIGGKVRISPWGHHVLRYLGYWNCYGAYYAELFGGFSFEKAVRVVKTFRERGVEVRYLGLDLWYKHDVPGLVRDYTPRDVYGGDLKKLCSECGCRTFLHMAALEYSGKYLKLLSPEGEVEVEGVKKVVALPSEPYAFYRELAREFRERHGAVGVWYDWLRTQQHLSRRLRCDPDFAERWFLELCAALGDEGLAIMLCMPTVGMLLASTHAPAVIATRTYTDYLFRCDGQVRKLRAKGMKGVSYVDRGFCMRQNMLLMQLAWSLGLYPYFDVFITNKKHVEGFEEPYAEYEALARALSAGIVGVGDREDQVDPEIVKRIALPDGTLVKPDEPAVLLEESLFDNVMLLYARSSVSGFTWHYVAAFNTCGERKHFRIDLSRFIPVEEYVIYDYFETSIVEGSILEGEVEPCTAKYYIAAPRSEYPALIGLIDRYITASSIALKSVAMYEAYVEATFNTPAAHVYRVGFAAPQDSFITAYGASVQSTKWFGGVLMVDVVPYLSEWSISVEA